MDKIIILDDIYFLKNNLERIKEIFRQESSSVLPLSDPCFFFLRTHGIECISYHDFENAGLYDDIYTFARNWGENWYRCLGEDLTLKEGYSFGFLYEWPMIHFFTHLLRVHLSLFSALKQLDPKEVVVLTAKKVELMHHISRWKHYDISMLTSLVKATVSALPRSCAVRSIELDYGDQKPAGQTFIEIIRRVFLFATGAFNAMRSLRRFFSAKKKKIVFFEGFRHFESILKEPALKGLEKIHLQKVIGPSLLKKLTAMDCTAVSLRRDRKKAHLEKPVFDKKKIHKSLEHFFVYRKINLLECVFLRLEFLLDEFFPLYMYPDLISVDKVLGRIAPDCLVTENDNTYNEKMLVCLAKKKNIPVAVMQNGETWIGASYKDKRISTHDFYPLIADYFFAFGDVNKQWYIHMGTDPRKVLVTGASRFDTYYQKRKALKQKEPSEKRRVLILLNDFGFNEGTVTQDMPLSLIYKDIELILGIASNNPDIDFYIRPHSVEQIWNEIFCERLKALSNVRIGRQENLEWLFSQVDLVVGYASTAQVEAAIFRIPVISFDRFGYCGQFPLWEYGLAEKAESAESLETLMKTLLYDEAKRRRVLKKASENLKFFNFDDDGKAGERVANFLARICVEGCSAHN